MKTLALLLLFAVPALGNNVITQFPDGSDSIGVPDDSYAGTCYVRSDSVPGTVVECSAAQRLRPNALRTMAIGPVDCASHARHTLEEPPLPLPNLTGASWRIASTGWCLAVRRTDTGEVFAPACHAENYQMPGWRHFGPGDSECWYIHLPDDAPFEYIVGPPPAGNLAVRALRTVRLWPKAKPLTTKTPPPAPDGTLPDTTPVPGKRAAYRYHHAATVQHP